MELPNKGHFWGNNFVPCREFVINPRRTCAARVTVVGSVCLSVCLSVKSHLTYGASVHPENAVTYSAGNDQGQTICGVFSETDALQRSSTPSVVRPCVQSAIFPAESTHAWTEARDFPLVSHPSCREDGCEFRELPLIMPPSKV